MRVGAGVSNGEEERRRRRRARGRKWHKINIPPKLAAAAIFNILDVGDRTVAARLIISISFMLRVHRLNAHACVCSVT